MNTPNHESTERDRIYDEMVAYRAKLIADFEAIERQHTKNLADLDAVIATLDLRRTPQIGVDRKQCGNCGGWLVAGQGGWVHDRDGQMACKPGHSGPVAEPLAQTTAFPSVQPGDATQVIPAVPWAHLVNMPLNAGLAVTVHWVGGDSKTGTVFDITPDRLVIGVGQDVYDLAPADVRLVEPAGTGEPYYPPADAATEVIDRTATTAQDGGA